MNQIIELSRVAGEISGCSLCDLCQNRNNTVPGRGKGKLPPNIMFIGEAPGEDEDRLGKPFVGKAGDILSQAINYWKFINIYITNIVKCRPPKNRDPKPEEVDSCMPYLLKQIEILQPKSIVLLGKQAQAAFERHNIFHERLYHAYHPMYYGYRGKSNSYWEEFLEFLPMYKEIDKEWIPF